MDRVEKQLCKFGARLVNKIDKHRVASERLVLEERKVGNVETIPFRKLCGLYVIAYFLQQRILIRRGK